LYELRPEVNLNGTVIVDNILEEHLITVEKPVREEIMHYFEIKKKHVPYIGLDQVILLDVNQVLEVECQIYLEQRTILMTS
jgi:hypothetical protein